MGPQAKDAKSIFLKAVEYHAPDERARYLDEACQSDAPLRDHVEALLGAYAEPNSLLDGQSLVAAIDRSIPDPVGTLIGPYKIRQQIGEGGFGVVYLAEQQHPVKRRVALKIIKPGMDTREVIARFEAERQALALMDHAHIAKVFDAAATEGGRPYTDRRLSLIHSRLFRTLNLGLCCVMTCIDTMRRLPSSAKSLIAIPTSPSPTTILG